MFRPHHREDSQLGVSRRPIQKGEDLLVFLGSEVVLRDELGGNGWFVHQRPQPGKDRLGARTLCPRVVGTRNQVYVSTTGFNPYRKSLGTPLVLEVNVRTEPPEGKPFSRPDLRALAVQVLSLTKLNWGSTDSLCAEPITTKYAGSIAYLTAAFLRQGSTFHLHPVLEQTPWFI